MVWPHGAQKFGRIMGPKIDSMAYGRRIQWSKAIRTV